MNFNELESLLLPLIGFLQFLMFYKRNPKQGVQNLIWITAASFVCNIFFLLTKPADLRLEYLLVCLVTFIFWNIQKFAYRYLDGDRNYSRFFLTLSALNFTTIGMALSQTNLLFWFFWTSSNFLLVILMIHKPKWKAASAAGKLALLNFIFGSVCLGLGFGLLSIEHHQFHVYGKILLIIAAMSQSAIYPFHRWLLSSLNSPTPVSALMHAGIVNAGGVLLIKYQQIFINDPVLLNCIFVLGFISAIIGGFWKLVQTDIKKMLANSTMAQMGFMFLQCGMGLFPAALAHLCWHSLFKAYLFLNAGSALQAKFKSERDLCSLKDYVLVVFATGMAILSFTIAAKLSLTTLNTQWILVGIVGISAWQLSKNLVGKHHLFLDLFLVICSASIYGLTIRCIEACLGSYQTHGVPLNAIYILGWFTLSLIWLLSQTSLMKKIEQTPFWASLYMKSLNASQPSPQTLTTTRQHYDY